MQDARSEVMQLLNGNDSFGWNKAVNLMLDLKWSKRKRVEALSHVLAFNHRHSPYNKKGKLRLKRTLIFYLTKRLIKMRIIFDCLWLTIPIKNQKAKFCVVIGNKDFDIFVMKLIKNNSI